MKRSPSLLALVLMVFPAVLSAAAFEGKVQMKMTDAKGKQTQVEYYIKDGLMRTDMDLGKNEKMSVITDTKKGEVTTLMPGQNMYMTRPLSEITAVVERTGKTNDMTFERTGETETILGYKCVKYVSKSKDLTSDIWATDQLGRYMGLGMGSGGPMGGKRGGGQAPAWEKELAGKDFFPLRVVSLNAKGKEQFRLEATNVEKGSQPIALFSPPPGAKKFSFGGMMQGLGFPGKKH